MRLKTLVGPLVLLAIASGCGEGNEGTGMRVLEDASFLAFTDDNGNGQASDDPPRTVHFSDYFSSSHPGTRILMLNAAAGWCGPCMHEAARLSAFAEEYAPQGVTVVTAVFQNGDGDPADAAFAKLWAQTFQLAVPTLVDSAFVTGRYFDVNALPANMFVDATSGRILQVATGATPGDDPLVEFRHWLDDHLARP